VDEPPDFDPASDPNPQRRAMIADPLQPDPRFARVLQQVYDPRFALVRIEGQTFRSQQVFLDGRRFVRCSFIGCTMTTYVGRFLFDGCDVVESAIFTDGPAAAVSNLVNLRESDGPPRPTDTPPGIPDLVSVADIRVEEAMVRLREQGLTQHVRETFRDQDVYVDGREFVECRFERCRMIVTLGWFKFEGNQTLIDCPWHTASFVRTAVATLEQVKARETGGDDGIH
jgi:hypothetical protein